jgi:FkbM family methyltransferase
MTLKRSVGEYVFRSLGIEPIPFRNLENFPLKLHLQKLFALYQVDCVVDVGAYEGTYGRFLRDEVGYQGLILSFEPQPKRFEHLSRLASRDRAWKAYPVALGAEAGRATMNVMNDGVFSSLLSPLNNASSTTHKPMSNAVVEQIQIDVQRLDALVISNQIPNGWTRGVLKTDAQGFDQQIFFGARSCLSKFVAIQSEISVVPIYENAPLWNIALSTYQSAGFELSGLFPVSFDDKLRVVEFDAVLVASGRNA